MKKSIKGLNNLDSKKLSSTQLTAIVGGDGTHQGTPEEKKVGICCRD